MKKTLYKLRQYIPVIMFAAAVFCIVNEVNIISGDDTVFLHAPTLYGGIDYAISSLYDTWAGRIPVLYTTMMILNMDISIWRTMTTIIFIIALMTLVMACCYSKKNIWVKTTLAAVGAVLLALIHPDIWYQSILWITGCFNYLWGTAAMLVVLIPFFYHMMNRSVPKWLYVISALCTFYGCYIEQSAAFAAAYSVFVLFILCIRHKGKFITYIKNNIGLIIITVFIIINSILLFTAPGNYVRNESELIQWFPSFDMYDTWDRIIFGLANTMNALRMYGVWFMIILCLLLLKTCIHRRDYFMSVLAILVSAYFIGMAFYPMNIENAYWLYDFSIRKEIYFEPSLYQSLTIALSVIGIIAILLWKLFDCEKDSKYLSVIFIGAIFTGIVMGFSPTMFASGDRVYFILFIFLILVICDCLSCMINKGDLRVLLCTPTILIILEIAVLYWAYQQWILTL